MSIAVIIPAYNSTPYLRETLQSVFDQTHQPDEILVVDDGSTDGTPAFAESFAPRVRVFRRTRHRPAANRNFGAEQTSCEWLAFLDHDDIWEPNKLERQMQELALHPEADLCYTGRVLLMQRGDTATLGRVVTAPPAKDIRRSLFKSVTFLPSCVVIRRSALLAVNGFNPLYFTSEDYDLWLRLLHAGVKFAACPEPLVQYREHDRNTSKNMAWFEDCTRVYRQLVVPYLPRTTGWLTYFKFLSEREGDLAYAMRKEGNPAHLAMMAKSVIHWPFNDSLRYKVLMHMLYRRFAGSTQRA